MKEMMAYVGPHNNIESNTMGQTSKVSVSIDEPIPYEPIFVQDRTVNNVTKVAVRAQKMMDVSKYSIYQMQQAKLTELRDG